MKPKHDHECSTCEYLGTLNTEGKDYDFYVHIYQPESSLLNIYIARYGKDGKYITYPYYSEYRTYDHWNYVGSIAKTLHTIKLNRAKEYVSPIWVRPS